MPTVSSCTCELNHISAIGIGCVRYTRSIKSSGGVGKVECHNGSDALEPRVIISEMLQL